MHEPVVNGIKQVFPDLSFGFKPVVTEDILTEIKKLNSAKATQEHDILTKILQENADLFVFFDPVLMCRNTKIFILSETS